MSRAEDTIYALSSGAPPSGVAVVRMSGSAVPPALEAVCGILPLPRQATLRAIHGSNGLAIDRALVLHFPAPHSFTGEDCAELHLHGGRAVINAVLQRLGELGLRHAEAGEFSRRAFENGKLDLVEVEGLADLIAAETEMQRRLAMEQSGGALSSLYQSWMRRLTRARALIEAALDFPDEDDIPGDVSASVWGMVAEIARDIENHLAGRKSAEIIRDGFKVVIVGRPNAGKSSLLNALARREAAIVTAIPGTTRDIISVDLDLEGYLVHLVDTAGLRETKDIVEAEGIRRARTALQSADLVLLLREAGDTGPDAEIGVNAPVVRVMTKVDLFPTEEKADCLSISVVTGEGIDSLTKRIFDSVAAATQSAGLALIVRERQRALLSETLDALHRCIADNDMDIELRSEYLRQSSHLLGKLTGFVDVDDMLGVIFSEFCIGK